MSANAPAVTAFAPVRRAKTKQVKESLMISKKIKKKSAVGAIALLLGSSLAALAGNDNRAPEVPFQIAVDPGNKIQFHGFGVGFQVYTWNGTDWGKAVPEATLFVGGAPLVDHFAGPTWETPSG